MTRYKLGEANEMYKIYQNATETEYDKSMIESNTEGKVINSKQTNRHDDLHS